MKKKNKVLSLNFLQQNGGFTASHDDNKLVSRFCTAVENGETPDKDDLVVVANALSVFRKGAISPEKVSLFTERLGIKRNRGQARKIKRSLLKEVDSVLRFYMQQDAYIAQGETTNDAKIAARALMRKELGIGVRQADNKIKEHEKLAMMLYRLEKLEREILETKS